jgi:hypothetical protein
VEDAMKKISQEEIVRAYVAKANIDGFRRMLDTETDPFKRGVITELLAAEENRQMARRREATKS